MSALTKKKHVFQETINNYALPSLNQMIVKVKAPRGNNLHDVQTPTNEEYIVSMPTKFRKTVWVKRGDYLIVEPIEEGNKVKAEIVHILTKDHIRYLKSQNVWPKEFDDSTSTSNVIPDDMLPPSSSEDDDDDEEVNETNETETHVHNINRTNLFNSNSNNNKNVNSNDDTNDTNKLPI